MIVAFDASVLVYLVTPDADAPLDKATGQPVVRCADRVSHLIATLQREKATIVIPTTSLAEVFVRAGDAAPQWLAMLERNRHFRIADFDKRAAIEHAARQAARKRGGTKSPAADRRIAKFDDQIVAIAAVAGVSIIYSDDGDIRALAGGQFEVKGIVDLPLPPESAQGSLPFGGTGRPPETGESE
ncbi:hypothetical protein [Inquilinus sp.]|uniref:type II toxin-antitoxin system VapC family toxin n=1 Tax=Inquilinus sp. TaxID=1932117 RepID=UPI0031D827E1